MAKLMPDEFAPSEYTGLLDFWQIPKDVVKCKDLTLGAKLLYGVIYGNAYKEKQAYPSYKALRKHLGGPSKATMQRWIAELVDARLIRVIQRGRGISNVYRMLRSPLVGNMSESEYAYGPYYVYTGTLSEEPLLVTEQEGLKLYAQELEKWVYDSLVPNVSTMPKPCFKSNPVVARLQETARWMAIDQYMFFYDGVPGTEFEIAPGDLYEPEWIHPEDRD